MVIAVRAHCNPLDIYIYIYIYILYCYCLKQISPDSKLYIYIYIPEQITMASSDGMAG